MAFRVPNITSVNTDEFKPDLYVIAFAPELIGYILEDKKLTTYRYGTKYDYLKVGDSVQIQNSKSTEIVGNAVITEKSSTTFKDLPIINGAHESYRNKECQREVLSGYYAYIGRAIRDDDIFLSFSFKLVNQH
jgi:hypothetical protein